MSIVYINYYNTETYNIESYNLNKKEYIYKIIDNKIDYFKLSDFIKKCGCSELNFKDLLNAIKLNKSINTLDLSNLDEITISLDFILTKLITFINNKKNITTLILSKCELTLEELEPLLNTLQNNTFIKTLDLSHNNIDFFLDKKYYDFIHNINKLKIYYNKIYSSCNLNKDIIINYKQFLKAMNIQLNQIKNDCIKNNPLFNMLLKNKTITTLNISNIDDDSKSNYYDNELNILSDILQQNNTIKELDLSFHYYSIKNILKFIKNNKSIETLLISLKKSENTKDNLELIKKYYNENDYLQQIYIN